MVAVDNHTPFAAEALFLSDENGQPVIVPVVKATYDIRRGGILVLAESQRPVDPAGAMWGAPEVSSYRYEPETALTKLATDVVLIGSAHADRGVTRMLDVHFQVGPVEKTLRVFGDRAWRMRMGGSIAATEPEPFERIPLVYERAFGGWDRSDATPSRHTLERRNPVGTGFQRGRSSFEDGIRLPNIEDPRHPIRSFGDTPPPMGVGFVSPDWEPRVELVGTYDDEWLRTRMPLLPLDFDRRFFNAASPGLITPQHLLGDEAVRIEHAVPEGTLSFRLPRAPAPTWTIGVARQRDRRLETRLDTVIVDTDDSVVILLWRPADPVPGDPHSVRTLAVAAADVPIVAR